MIDGRYMRTDNEETLDLMLDPPCVVVNEIHQAVRRWRTRRLVQELPLLLSPRPDHDGGPHRLQRYSHKPRLWQG